MQNPLAKFMPQFGGVYPKPFEALFKEMTLPVNSDEEKLRNNVWLAYDYALQHHEGQKRSSGKPYFEHCLKVGQILASWGMDHNTVIAGLLHDTIEDTEAIVDNAIELVKKIEMAVRNNYDRLWWIHSRGSNGFFSEEVFE